MTDMTDIPTDLYRHFDVDGGLLYVGISINTLSRLSGHRSVSGWYDTIASIEITKYPNRTAALMAENEAIREEAPAHNISGKVKQELDPPLEGAEASRLHLLNSITFSPIYTVDSAAHVLGMSATRLKGLCEDGGIGCVDNGTVTRNYKDGSAKTFQKYMITGWQLIDYLEALQQFKPEKRSAA